MNKVTDQYEALPYPARDPKDEKKRLITGSPSHPYEIDHFLFGGARDWSKPFKVLVAGGGTGDALIQIAQTLTSAGQPYDITYVDLSTASREIAEARAKERGLDGITFVTGSLLDAPKMGQFDYIDCCGVLHHLPEPQEGFNALSAALSDEGGIGLMVYAPFGRAGVYPLQEAFATTLTGTVQDRLRRAKVIYNRIPGGHPFKRNPNVSDHKSGDAGFYDLLLHTQDRPYRIGELIDALEAAGLQMTGSPQAYMYDPLPILGDPGLLVGLGAKERMDLAEALWGTIRLHVVYAAKSAEGRVAKPTPTSIPHLKGVSGPKLAEHAAKKGVIPINFDGGKVEIPVPGIAARALGFMDGQNSLQDIAKRLKTDWISFSPVWASVSEPLTKHGVLHYSALRMKKAG